MKGKKIEVQDDRAQFFIKKNKKKVRRTLVQADKFLYER
jgi:hypothetical protein